MADTSVSIRPALRRDAAELSAMLARAFDDDPPFVWLLPVAETRQRRLRRFFSTLLRYEVLGHDCVEVACDGDRVIGAALWLPPGKWVSPVRQQLRALPTNTRAFGRRLGYAGALQRAGARIHPHEPHWYLCMVGVDPERQGRGVGGTMLRSRLDRCDQERMPAYLESSKTSNVPLYEYLGFQATKVLALPEGAPVVTAMWRPGMPGRPGNAAADPA